MDWKMILSYCKNFGSFRICAEINPVDGVTASDFVDWFENGFGAGDVAIYEDEAVMIGKTHRNASKIVAKLSDDKISILDMEIASEGLKMANFDIADKFHDLLFQQNLQFNWKTLCLDQKFIPEINDRIIFHGNGLNGLGVVRNINRCTGDMTLYCYYIYETKACGYSMREDGIVNLKEFWFEPMDNGESRQTQKNGVSCQRRLNRELERYGKIWNERLHRIEPLSIQVENGEKYWYITDKMTLIQDVERGLQLSRTRANAGNYFRRMEDGLKVLGLLQDELRNLLASPDY